MQLEQEPITVTNVTDSINEKFNATFKNDKLTVLNPQARGFIPQHVSGLRNHSRVAYNNDYAESSRNVQRCVSRRVLDAGNQDTALSTDEYGNCPQFRVSAATWPKVYKLIASESYPNATLNAYLDHQGGNEYINLATQVGYGGTNIALVFFKNQVRCLKNESSTKVRVD